MPGYPQAPAIIFIDEVSVFVCVRRAPAMLALLNANASRFVPQMAVARCLCLFEQIDAMGGKRGRVSVGSNSDRQTLNQLLACMDGFTKNEGVIVIGASMCPARATAHPVHGLLSAAQVPCACVLPLP